MDRAQYDNVKKERDFLMTRILVVGASGQVAHALDAGCPEGVALRLTSRQDLDLLDLDGLTARFEALMDAFNPHFVINAAAYTAVDRAQSEPADALAVNATAPGILARVCGGVNCPILHYSTDYVFDGTKDTPYCEDDLTRPLSVYGSSKLEGERAILAANRKSLILRTSWVYSAHGGNFLKTMLRLASERDALSVVNDQFGTPTSADLIARVSFQVINAMLAQGAHHDDPRWGLYHLTASGSTSWHGYASYLIAKARQMGFPVRVHQDNIKPVGSDQFPTVAVRPTNSRLSTQKICTTFGLTLPEWNEGVDAVLGKLACGS